MCQLCNLCVEDLYDRTVLRFKDKNHIAEVKGHGKCIDEIEGKLKKIKSKTNRNMSVKTELKELGLELDNHVVWTKES